MQFDRGESVRDLRRLGQALTLPAVRSADLRYLLQIGGTPRDTETSLPNAVHMPLPAQQKLVAADRG